MSISGNTHTCERSFNLMKPLLKKELEKIPSTLCQYGKIKVNFSTSEKLDYCIRIRVDVEFLQIQDLDVKYVLLPPIHRLTQKCYDIGNCLKKSSKHELFISKQHGEGIICYLDGISVEEYWDFLKAKPVMNKILRDNTITTSSQIETIKNYFHLYNLGTEYSLSDIENLSTRNDSFLNELSLKLLKEIYNRWFYQICVAPGCIRKTLLVCLTCKKSVCSVECKYKHNKGECIDEVLGVP